MSPAQFKLNVFISQTDRLDHHHQTNVHTTKHEQQTVTGMGVMRDTDATWRTDERSTRCMCAAVKMPRGVHNPEVRHCVPEAFTITYRLAFGLLCMLLLMYVVVVVFVVVAVASLAR